MNYFISYYWQKGEGWGFGNVKTEINKKITDIETIRELEGHTQD